MKEQTSKHLIRRYEGLGEGTSRVQRQAVLLCYTSNCSAVDRLALVLSYVRHGEA